MQEDRELLREYREVRQALSELAAIYNDAPVGLGVIGADYRYQRINHRLAELNGVSAEAHIGKTIREHAHLTRADLVVMVAAAGENAQAASIIGEACSVKRVMTTALVLGGSTVSDEALSKTLSHLRPWALMLVIASAEEYIADMLTALRA